MKEEIHYWIHIAEWLSEESKRRDVSNVLDIGGAYGTLSVYCQKLFGNEIYCSDFMDEYLSRQLIEKYNIHFKVNNIELDPLPWDRKFDMIIFTEILEHLNFHPVPTLRKIRDSLSDDGVLFLSTPDASQWGRVTKYYQSLSEIPEALRGQPVIDDHVWQYEKSELLDVVDAAGFKVLKFAYSPGLLNRHFNLMLAKCD